MTTLQVLMPMGGLGQRFRDVGVFTPKPLIEVGGIPMFKRALRSLAPYPGAKQLTVIVRTDAEAEHALSSLVLDVESGAQIVPLGRDTRGAVETSLEARDVLDDDQPLIIMDCDIAFESSDYFGQIDQALAASAAGDPNGLDGLLLSFDSREPRYSYAEVDSGGQVIRTAEKNPISSNALMGAYFFTKASSFFEAAESLMSRPISAELPEYYVSLVFNELIEAGKNIGLARGDFYSFGTPGELAEFEATGMPVGAKQPL